MTRASFPREFRAAWVATAADIDWPSRSEAVAVSSIDRLGGASQPVVFAIPSPLTESVER